jgi:hypothetical protein
VFATAIELIWEAIVWALEQVGHFLHRRGTRQRPWHEA